MVEIIGTGFSVADLTENHKNIIKNADILVGGKRYLDFFKDIKAEKFEITNNIPLVVEKIKKSMATKKIVVLASGDSLFFGIGVTLVRELGKEDIIIHPNISSVQAAFAAIKEPWHDVKIISLHGKKDPDLDLFLQTENKIAILTDPETDPAWIAKRGLSENILNFKMCVLENLRTEHEKITWYETLEEVIHEKFYSPNIVVLFRKKLKADKVDTKNRRQDKMNAGFPENIKIYPGMPDDYFVHENGLITKAEIRSLVLSKLKLVSDSHIFWDLGAGSGSVSIEVSRFIPNGAIISVEKNLSRIAAIKENIKNFKVSNIKILHAELPKGLEALDTPDRIFIGGGGAGLLKIMEFASAKLAINGIMVVNTVLLQNIEPALKLLRMKGFDTDLIQVQVAVSKNMPFGDRLEALNPVWIISGKKR